MFTYAFRRAKMPTSPYGTPLHGDSILPLDAEFSLLWKLEHCRPPSERGSVYMRRSEAKEQIIRNPGRYLTPDNQSQHRHGGNISYVCPICGSGTGAKGTGITSKDGVHFTCWAGCFSNSDIIDIIGLQNGLTEYNAKLERACTEYGIDYKALEPDNGIRLAQAREDFRGMGADKENNKPITYNKHNTQQIQSTDYTQFFKICTQMRSDSDYLAKRGISEATQEHFSIGYCPNWKSPAALKKGYNPPATPRVIIPTSQYSYIARDTRPPESMSEKERQFAKMKEGSLELFNLKAIEESEEPVFVVEGEIDAISIYEAGHNAIALGSTTNYKKVLAYVKEHRPAKPLLIALDNDKSGEETAQKLIDCLRELNIECCRADINGGHKDPNEYLVADREGFIQALETAIEASRNAKEAEKQEYLNNSTATYLWQFIGSIGAGVDTPYTPTGFRELDRNLGGGLYEGLYVIGAISSLGKTTLALQIADQVAKGGRDVLIFSLEMARNELIAKSLSRLTAQLSMERGTHIEKAKTTRGITVYQLWKSYSEEEKNLITDAVGAYGDYAERIFIIEGIGDIGVGEIRDTIKKHISITGNTPVVVLDYLQIVAPYNERATDKQNTDKAVLELKRMSRDYKLPVIGISSFNRDNYNAAVSMQAFKESGAIEYSSDVLIGLQLAGTGESGFDVDEEKKKNPRTIEAKILKNRNGRTGTTVFFEYYPQYNYFREKSDALGWTDAITPKRTKPTKRDRERAKIEAAFYEVAIANQANLIDMADKLDKSQKQVENLLKEYGGFIVKDGIVEIDPVTNFIDNLHEATSAKTPFDE